MMNILLNISISYKFTMAKPYLSKKGNIIGRVNRLIPPAMLTSFAIPPIKKFHVDSPLQYQDSLRYPPEWPTRHGIFCFADVACICGIF
jgi:hypothetical protein